VAPHTQSSSKNFKIWRPGCHPFDIWPGNGMGLFSKKKENKEVKISKKM